MFKAEKLGVQGLPREIDEGLCLVPPAISGVVRAVAEQGEPGVGRLGADLVFEPGFQPEPQLGDTTLAAPEWMLSNDFIVRDSFLGVSSGVLGWLC